ncbi:MAG: pyruvate kinase [Smithellaceae bacterium]|nr:pyruvate kinase [Smithellaceae bacterium]
MRKTKIVCTIGPACERAETIEEMIKAGMNVARLNFSHGTHKEHGKRIQLIRKIAKKLDVPVAILLDLGGPKIRVGDIPEPGIRLEPGQKFILTGTPVEGTAERVSVSYRYLPREVKAGDRLLLADGLMELAVLKSKGDEITCKVVTGGVLTSHKGINLPTGTLTIPSLTEKDKLDLVFGLSKDVDYVALSFVKKASDVTGVKNIIKRSGKDTPVIAKIEKHEALQEIEAIIAASDGIMVARGDLGVEIPLEEVPLIQKAIIQKANASGRPVITATQMLRSMVTSPRPTRAEAADVANAVLDGTDAVMLSEETASGSFPVEAVQYMDRIAEIAENGFPYDDFLCRVPAKTVSDSVSHASCILADHLEAKAIVAYTQSGLTARHISRFRPRQSIIALSPNERTVRRLTLFWGCLPRMMKFTRDTDDLIERAAKVALETKEARKGDLAVITLGHPLWVTGTTNMLRVKCL